MLRRIVRATVVLAALAAVVAAGGTLVLRSHRLSRYLLARAGRQLGLDLSAGSFSLGWGGRVTLGRVSARMPLKEAVVFSADRMKLQMGAVPLLVLGRPAHLRVVELDRPTVWLQQEANGRWNAPEIWKHVWASLEQAPAGPARLPEITVHHATLLLTDAQGTREPLGPVEFEGHRQGPLVWKGELHVPRLAEVEGQVVEGGAWTHDLRFQLQGIGPLLSRLLHTDLAEVRLAGRWKGSWADDTWQGVVQLEDLKIAQSAWQGVAAIAATPTHVTIRPQHLTVTAAALGGPAVHWTAGTVELSRAGIVAQALTATAGVLGVQLDGRWEQETRRAEFSGSWAAAGPDASLQCDGTGRLSVVWPPAGRREAQASFTARARTPLGQWHAVADVRGGGAQWRLSQWQIQVPVLSWTQGDHHLEVTNAAARIKTQGPEIHLASLSIPAARKVEAQAQFDAQTHQWSAQAAVLGWSSPDLGKTSLDFRLTAEGDGQEARLRELRVAAADNVLTAQGGLSLPAWDLKNVHLTADWSASTLGPFKASPPAGRWHLDAGLTGHLRSVALDLEATLAGQSIALGKQKVDRLQVPLHLRADPQRVEATTQPFGLLGGQWQVTGRYQFSDQATQIHVLAADLSLAAVAGLAGLPPDARGQAYAAIVWRMPGLDLAKAVAAGDWNARDIHLASLAADRAEGVLRLAGGLVRLDAIHLEHQGGRADAQVSLRLDQPEAVSVALTAHDWPVPLRGGRATIVVNGQTKLQTNVKKKTAQGDAQLTGRFVWQNKDLAGLHVAARVQEQTVDVQEFQAQVLGGTAQGTASVPLNHWTDSVAHLRWQGIQPQRLAAWWPAGTKFQGALAGTLAVEQTKKATGSGPAAGTPTQAPAVSHPLGPMRLVLDANISGSARTEPGGRFGPAQIDRCHLTGYLDPQRLLIEDASFEVLGGRLHAQGRLSAHAGRHYGALVADFNDLSLDQLVHVVDPNAAASPGRLAGRITVLPAFAGTMALSGTGQVRLTQSDLVDNRVVRTLYNTLNLHFGSQEPRGTGQVDLQFEGPAIVLSSVQYFNRGVEIRGAGRIDDLGLWARSPIGGYAVASTRVLQGVKLPGLGSVDRLLSVLQTGAVSVKIAGVVDDPEVQVVPLPEVLGPFRRLLSAQLHP